MGVSTRKAKRREDQMVRAGLVVLLGRAGGRATYTEAEYEELAAAYGGTRSLAIHAEVVRIGGRPPEVQLTLIRKEPANAELVS